MVKINENLKPFFVAASIIIFGLIIVWISYFLASLFFQKPPSLEAINVFVTAILGSAVSLIAALQITGGKY